MAVIFKACWRSELKAVRSVRELVSSCHQNVSSNCGKWFFHWTTSTRSCCNLRVNRIITIVPNRPKFHISLLASCEWLDKRSIFGHVIFGNTFSSFAPVLEILLPRWSLYLISLKTEFLTKTRDHPYFHMNAFVSEVNEIFVRRTYFCVMLYVVFSRTALTILLNDIV